MSSKLLKFSRLSRFESSGRPESLTLLPGLNIILGANNSGKTVWMRQFDFLLGSHDTPFGALDDMSRKYIGLACEFSIGATDFLLERTWGDDPSRSRLLLDERAISAEEFSEFMLEALGLPELRFPKGNPLGPRTWPRLTWRTLLRQMYRREDSWNDLAHLQPEGEQFAVFAQFLGLASSVFSKEYHELGEKIRLKAELQTRKHHFEVMLNEIGHDLVAVQDIPQQVTAESIIAALNRLEAEAVDAGAHRESVLIAARKDAFGFVPEVESTARALERELSSLGDQRRLLSSQVEASNSRVAALRRNKAALSSELNRLERAHIAGQIIGPLRVTHCPACDQRVPDRALRDNQCGLCLQEKPHSANNELADRLPFEINQILTELRETEELLRRVEAEGVTSSRLLSDLDAAIHRKTSDLRQLTSEAAWVAPPELGRIDREIGAITERIDQLKRLEGSLALRERISSQIDQLTREIAVLDSEVVSQKTGPPFEKVGDLLAIAMENYLNALNVAGQARWNQRHVTADISAEAIILLVNGKRWTTALGANLRAFFFMAIHHALLRLSSTPPCLYPGVVLLDFPANLSRYTGLSEDENYLLAPFRNLRTEGSGEETQVIAAGRAFQGLEGANVISLASSY